MILGSFADVPKDLLQEIKQLEEQFTVKPEKLKQITSHFINELEKGKSTKYMSCLERIPTDIISGLSVEGGSIVSMRLST